jgi:hypothetical protein
VTVQELRATWVAATDTFTTGPQVSRKVLTDTVHPERSDLVRRRLDSGRRDAAASKRGQRMNDRSSASRDHG